MKRMSLSPEEVEIIEGLRQQRAIWNQAIDAALTLVVRLEPRMILLHEEIAKLRKEGTL